MTSTLKLLRTIGSPFVPSSELAVSDGETNQLYQLAVRNKIGLLYLETLKGWGALGNLQSEYERGYLRYSETVATAARICAVLDAAGIDYVLYKFVKPYPSTPSDVDILFLGSDNDYRETLRMLFASSYFRLGAAPHQVIAYDLRGGIENMDTRLWGGKEGGVYYIDLYDEVAASHVIYVDKEHLRQYTADVELNGYQVRSLAPEADLAVGIAHSVIPEQLYTLADYYITLYCLDKMRETGITNFVAIIGADRLTLASRASLRMTAYFHQVAHGFIPEPLKSLADRLGVKDLGEASSQGDCSAPYRFGVLTVAGALAEKLPSGKFIKSAVVQMVHMLNPRFGKRVAADLIFRRRRLTY